MLGGVDNESDWYLVFEDDAKLVASACKGDFRGQLARMIHDKVHTSIGIFHSTSNCSFTVFISLMLFYNCCVVTSHRSPPTLTLFTSDTRFQRMHTKYSGPEEPSFNLSTLGCFTVSCSDEVDWFPRNLAIDKCISFSVRNPRESSGKDFGRVADLRPGGQFHRAIDLRWAPHGDSE